MLVFHLLIDGSAEEKIKRVFDLCDKDKDGTVSYKELKQFLSLFGMSDLADNFMESLDKDQNGRLTEQEFSSMPELNWAKCNDVLLEFSHAFLDSASSKNRFRLFDTADPPITYLSPT